MRLLVVVDMQNDFIDQILGFPEAEEIIMPVKDKIEQYIKAGDKVIFTQDTHYNGTYNSCRESGLVPLHCHYCSEGWKIHPELAKYAENKVLKPSFGLNPTDIKEFEYIITGSDSIEQIEIVGLVTNICVISCAISLMNVFTSIPIVVDASCCCSYNKDLHEKSLDVMEGLGITVTNR